MERRDFTRYLSSVLLCSALPRVSSASQKGDSEQHWFASASVDAKGKHWLLAFDQEGTQQLRYALPSRAHQVIKHPHQPWLLVVSRRPGNYLLVIDMPSGKLVSQYTAQEQQHFCGHMQISSNGQLLYTTENITATSEGQVVVRDLYASGKVVGQFSSGGIGPHQLKLTALQDKLIVANGGIHTRGREKLNLEVMQANLSYINLASQSIEQQVVLDADLAQLSIRHIDVNQEGQVLIAMQYQGERTAQVPLVALHKPDTGLSFLEIPKAEYFSLQHYCGSACFDRSGQIMAVSAPRGDRVLFWRVANAEFITSVKVRDGCGIAPAEAANEFVISSGRGRVYRYNPLLASKALMLNNSALQWDNHLASI